VADNGTLDLNGFSPTIGGLGGNGTVTSSVAGTSTLSVGNNNLASTFAGVIQNGSGTVALTMIGTSTLTLTGSNTYGGSTTISAGTLQVGNNTTTGTVGSGAVVDNASLVFDRSGTATIGNVISGSGTVAQSSSGTLILTGNNSFTGISTISTGTLQLGNSSALGAGITTANGTLDLNGYSPTLGSLSGSGTVLSSVAGSITLSVGNSNQASTFTGVIENGSATIALAKIGSGSLTLTGANSFSGGTTIDGGTLAFASGSLVAVQSVRVVDVGVRAARYA
jgi:autotransporter-associated beta strand protein